MGDVKFYLTLELPARAFTDWTEDSRVDPVGSSDNIRVPELANFLPWDGEIVLASTFTDDAHATPHNVSFKTLELSTLFADVIVFAFRFNWIIFRLLLLLLYISRILYTNDSVVFINLSFAFLIPDCGKSFSKGSREISKGYWWSSYSILSKLEFYFLVLLVECYWRRLVVTRALHI